MYFCFAPLFWEIHFTYQNDYMSISPKSNSLPLLYILDKLKPDYLKYMFLWHTKMFGRIVTVDGTEKYFIVEQIKQPIFPCCLPLSSFLNPLQTVDLSDLKCITIIWSFPTASIGACWSSYLKQSSQHSQPVALCASSLDHHCLWAFSWPWVSLLAVKRSPICFWLHAGFLLDPESSE